MTRRLWIATLLASACDVSLDTPRQLRVNCANDGECVEGRCSPSVFVCIDADDDDTAPRVLSAESTDTRHVAVVFSRAVDPQAAADFGIYVFSGGLVPLAAVPSPDGLSVEVETTPQKQRTYILDVIELVDPLGRQLDRSPVQFLGVGEPPSTRTPTPLSPPDHQLLTDPAVTIRWSALVDATTYTLDVSLTADFETPIDGSPFSTATTEQPVIVPGDGTYYWRVIADTSGDPPETQAFAVFDERVYAYCAEGANCTAPPTWDAGSSRRPLQRISRALSLASFLAIGDVRIAGRGGTAAYEETLVISDPVLTVSGAYDPTFTAVDAGAHPTVIHGAPTTVRLVSSQPLTLTDISVDGEVNAAIIIDGVTGLLANRVHVNAINGARALDARLCGSQPVVFNSGSFTTGPNGDAGPSETRISSCLVGMTGMTLTGATLAISDQSMVELDDSTVEVTSGRYIITHEYSGGLQITAVRISDASLLLDHSRVQAGIDDQQAINTGLDIARSDVEVDASMIVAAKPAFGTCDPDPCQGDSTGIVGIGSFGATTSLRIVNSVVVAKNGSAAPADEKKAPALSWHGGGNVAVLYSVLYASDGVGFHVDLAGLGDDLQVLNSAFACDGSGAGFMNIDTQLPRLLRTSVVVGCDQPVVLNGTTYSNSAAVLALADVTHAIIDFDVLASPVSSAFPSYAGPDSTVGTGDDNWACGPALAAAGSDSTLNVCGGNGASACPVIITDDALGNPRIPPTSIGPIEVD